MHRGELNPNGVAALVRWQETTIAGVAAIRASIDPTVSSQPLDDAILGAEDLYNVQPCPAFRKWALSSLA